MPTVAEATDPGVLIVALKAYNFKSFLGEVLVGPFKSFSAIIGPNGSGKSNTMDAVCFALGERPQNMRVRRLSDLISTGENVDRSKNSSVTLIINCAGIMKHFKREISPSNTSIYSIDGITVSNDNYLDELKALGLSIKAKSFIVYQGTVENMAIRDPKEMTTLFEELSGSNRFKEDYDSLKKEVEKLDEVFKGNLLNRKRIFQDQRHVNLAKEDFEKFSNLKNEIAQMKEAVGLLSSLKLNLEMKASVEDIDTNNVNLQKCEKDLEALNAEMQTMDKNTLKNSNMLDKLDLKIRNIESEIKKEKPQAIETKVRLVQCNDEIQGFEKLLSKTTNESKTNQESIRKFEAELGTIETQHSQLGDQTLSFSQKFPDMPTEALDNYNKLKEKASIALADEYSRVKALDKELVKNQTQLNHLKSSKTQFFSVIKQKKKDIESYTNTLQTKNGHLEQTNLSNQNLKKEFKEINDEIVEAKKSIQSTQAELDEVNSELSNAQSYQNEGTSKRKRAETLETLQRLFKGVHGRLYELCEPRNQKYNLAVTRIFGQHMNSIVVDTYDCGRECLDYLKNERIGQEMFLPLDNLHTYNISPSVSKFAESQKIPRLIDVISFDEKYAKLFSFICKDTLVCQNADDAKRVAFESNENGESKMYKTVSLDGVVFKKSGVITGGNVELMVKAKAWDESYVRKLIQKQASLNFALKQNLLALQKENLLGEINSKFKSLELRENMLTESIKSLQNTIESENQASKELYESLEEIEKKLHGVESENEKIYSENSEIQSVILNKKQEIFSSFCKKYRIEHISIFDECEEIARKQIEEIKLEQNERRTKIEAQLELLNSNDYKTKIDRFTKTLSELRSKQSNLANENDAIENRITNLETKKSGLLSEKNEFNSLAGEKSLEIADLESKIKKLVTEQRQIKRKLIYLEGDLQNKISARNDLIKNCKIEGIGIKFVDGEDDVIDYSLIQDHVDNIKKPQSVAKYVKQAETKIKSLEQSLFEIPPPNEKFIEKYDKINQDFKDINSELDQNRKQLSEMKAKFNEVKKQRSDSFNNYFDKVSLKVDEIYRDLTNNPGFNAYLSRESDIEPYLHGITYSCIAPGKRFTSLENLSGGEKTLATLALIFSLNPETSEAQTAENSHLDGIRLPSLFILDEVDAALDFENIEKLAKFIVRKSSNDSAQFLLISLKLDLFCNASALFGLYKSDLKTKVLSLDLTKYSI